MIHLDWMELVDKNSCHKLRNLSVEQRRVYLVEKLLKVSSAWVYDDGDTSHFNKITSLIPNKQKPIIWYLRLCWKPEEWTFLDKSH